MLLFFHSVTHISLPQYQAIPNTLLKTNTLLYRKSKAIFVQEKWGLLLGVEFLFLDKNHYIQISYIKFRTTIWTPYGQVPRKGDSSILPYCPAA